MPGVANYKVITGSQLLSNHGSSSQCSYQADFGRQSKVGLVTANSPGTVTSPLNFGWNQAIVRAEPGLPAAQLTGMSPRSDFSSESVGIL